MPPWHAAPSFGDLAGARELDEREIQVLNLWSSAGAKRGEDSEAPERRFESVADRMGPPDLVLDLPDALSLPAEGPDLFRSFVLRTDLAETCQTDPIRCGSRVTAHRPRIARCGSEPEGGGPASKPTAAQPDAAEIGAGWSVNRCFSSVLFVSSARGEGPEVKLPDTDLRSFCLPFETIQVSRLHARTHSGVDCRALIDGNTIA